MLNVIEYGAAVLGLWFFYPARQQSSVGEAAWWIAASATAGAWLMVRVFNRRIKPQIELDVRAMLKKRSVVADASRLDEM